MLTQETVRQHVLGVLTDQDPSKLAFELVLQPSQLEKKLLQPCLLDRASSVAAAAAAAGSVNGLVDDEGLTLLMGVLSEFLQQLHHTNNNNSINSCMVNSNGNNNGNGSNDDCSPGGVPANPRRKASVQLMVLQIWAALQWRLEPLQRFLPVHLQIQLVETLLAVCLGPKGRRAMFANPEAAAAGIGEACKNPESLARTENSSDLETFKNSAKARFASSLYMRWVLRTLPKLSLPQPPVTKQQIYSKSGAAGAVLDPTLAGQVAGAVPVAVKLLEDQVRTGTFPASLPSTSSFKLTTVQPDSNVAFPPEDCWGQFSSSAVKVECSDKQGSWAKLDPNDSWKCMVLFDLGVHHFYVENYASARTCLGSVAKLPEAAKKHLELHILRGYCSALSLSLDDVFADGTKLAKGLSEFGGAADDPVADMLAKLEQGNNQRTVPPLYRRINAELGGWFKCSVEKTEQLAEKNVLARLEAGWPQNAMYFSRSYSKKSTFVVASRWDRTLLDLLGGAASTDGLFCQDDDDDGEKLCSALAEKPWNKIKHPKLKRRDAFLALLREFRPERVAKMYLDLSKLIPRPPLRKQVARWAASEATSQINSSLIDPNLAFTFLSKISQLVRMEAFTEASALYSYLERQVQVGSKAVSSPSSAFAQRLAFQNLLCSMQLYLLVEPASSAAGSFDHETFAQQCESSLDQALDSSDPRVMETVLGTLLNRGEFDLLLSRCNEKRWRIMMQFSGLLSTMAMNALGRRVLTPSDFKKTCRAMAELTMPCVQGGGTKRSASSANSTSEALETKHSMLRLIGSLKHPDLLSVLGAFFVTLYNSAIDDRVKEVVSELPSLPVSAASSTLSEEAVLALVGNLAARGSKVTSGHQSVVWLRVQAEVCFALSNYPQALRFFLKTLIMSTNYFQKPWSSGNDWDEVIFHKMVRCTAELGQLATTVVLCQFVSDCDYAVAFRYLEDRGSCDAMDDLYAYIWDVTLLEYAVAMHTRRGEFSRRKRALDCLSQLEINANNNEEILREARAARRGAFLRYMTLTFL